MSQESAYSAEAAEMLALDALAWIASEDDLLDVFLGSTGLDRSDLKARLGEAELLSAVLDFLMMDDAWVMRFCDARGLGYGAPAAARRGLPGGAEVHWT